MHVSGLLFISFIIKLRETDGAGGRAASVSTRPTYVDGNPLIGNEIVRVFERGPDHVPIDVPLPKRSPRMESLSGLPTAVPRSSTINDSSSASRSSTSSRLTVLLAAAKARDAVRARVASTSMIAPSIMNSVRLLNTSNRSTPRRLTRFEYLTLIDAFPEEQLRTETSLNSK
jgi:hypothetical protein